MGWTVIRKIFWILTVLLMCGQDVFSCPEPIAGRNFIQSGLDGDIVLAIHASGDHWKWEILSAHVNEIDLRSHFLLHQEGPFTYLLVVKGIRHPQGPKKYWKLSIALECKGDKEKKVYTIEAKVISANALQKIQLRVPENASIGTLIYKHDASQRVRAKRFRIIPTMNESVDANRFFSLNSETGAISLDSKLDYESDNKLMKMITVQQNQDATAKISIFWIKVTNINDNQPEIFLHDCAIQVPCEAKSYVSEATQNGVLYIRNSSTLGARDKDGDEIKFQITKVKPKEYEHTCSINNSNGIITLENIESLPNKTRFYITVQASDGELSDTVSIMIKVKKPPKKLTQHPSNLEQSILDIDNSGNPFEEDLFETTEPKENLIDLPAWFLNEELQTTISPVTITPNYTSAINQSAFDYDEKEHVLRIRNECASSELIASMNFSELSAVLSNVNESAIKEFCNVTKASKANLTLNSTDGLIFNEILTFCKIMPQDALTLFDFKGDISNKTKLIQFCRNSTVEHWLKGTMSDDGTVIAMLKTNTAARSFSKSSWCFTLSISLMLSFARWNLSFLY